MKSLLRTGLFLTFAMAAACLPAHSQSFIRLIFQDGKGTTASGLHLQLHEPDDPVNPTLWQGPLTVSSDSGSCNVAASLISNVFLSSTGRLAVVVSVSGSKTNIGFFNAHTCMSMWPVITTFTSGIFIQRNLLEIHPLCEGAEGKFSCSSASIYRLSDNTAPELLPTESLALTKQIYGISFVGKHTFAQPPPSLAPSK